MKSLFTVVVLVSFIGVAVFGLVGMYHNNSQNHNSDCIWATSQSADCPKQSNLIGYLTLHLNAFKDFATVTFGHIATSLLVLSLFVIGAIFGILLKNLALPKLSLAYHRLKWLDSFRPPSLYKFIRWLSLHENSPSTA